MSEVNNSGAGVQAEPREMVFAFVKGELDAHEHLSAAFERVLELVDESADDGEALAEHNSDAGAHADLREAVGVGSAAAVAEHDDDPEAHEDLWTELAGKAGTAQLEAVLERLDRLEEMLANA